MSIALLRERAAAEGLPLGTVAAEVLHVILLDALFARPGSEVMAFQGGSCLHLVHGAYRYSEDLDLAGTTLDAVSAEQIVARVREPTEKLVVQILGTGEHAWRAPRVAGLMSTYWYQFTPGSLGRRIRVKIELACFPTHRPAVLPVRSELDLLQRRPLVNALEAEELLVEKVTAVLGRRYLKGRDLFDLWYLDAVLGTAIDSGLLRAKLDDYDVAPDPERVKARLAAAAAADLRAEMERFLPSRHRSQLAKGGYEAIRRRSCDLLRRAVAAVGLL
ncbi:MAG TPA: nucleotidyl transferase AbiEii/AbiGii toxin family protein [Vicinamibacteria bacterium]|nr:nucleotidyl transferase AbiEii/AbiGii toxin family protein [Vicinamibacteria bacterium]